MLRSLLRRLIWEELGGAGRSTIVGSVIAASIFIGAYATVSGGGGSCAYPTCFPDATNTGVPAGTSLTAYTGPTDITVADTVIDSKTINNCLTILAPRVIIKNSSITCTPPASGGDGFVGVWVRPDNSSTYSVTIQDTEVSCGNTENTGISGWNITATRLNIHDCANGMSLAKDVTLTESYIHDLTCCTDNHTDGIQYEGGSWASTGNVTSGLTIRHNRIYGWDNNNLEGSNSSIISDINAQNDLVEQNLFAGGTYTVYCSSGTTTGYVVRNNHFSTIFETNVGQFGPVNGCLDEDGGGNVYHESGSSIDMTFGG